MFGFGKPANEKAVINLFALQFEQIGISGREAVASATKLVDEVLGELRLRGIDPFKTTQGDEYVTKEAFAGPRLQAGLTAADIKFHWNRPLLIGFAEMKMREMFNFIIVDMARQQGKDTSVAATHYKKTFPRYGDPTKWDPQQKFNAGLSASDADLYPEFANRIDAWRRKVSDAEIDGLIAEHGTLNAVVRHQISLGAL